MKFKQTKPTEKPVSKKDGTISIGIRGIMIIVAVILGIIATVAYFTFMAVSDFYDNYQVKFNQVLKVEVKPPFEIIEREMIVPAEESTPSGAVLGITDNPYAVPEGFPEPKTDLQKEVVKLINETWVDSEMGVKLAWCESSYGLNVENSQSSARGVFQFIKGTWVSTRDAMGEANDLSLRFDLKENIKSANYLYERDGFRHWEPSANCVLTGSH